MGIRFFVIFIIFFAFSSIFLFYQKSKTLNIVSDLVNTPLMELEDSKIYNITYEGITAYLQSRIAKRYKDRYLFYNIFSNKKDSSKNEQLWANKGIMRDERLTLLGNVLYKGSSKQTLKSQKVIYNLKKDILSSNSSFVATYKSSKIVGSSFIYYKKEKRLLADNIKASIVMEEK